MYNCDICGDVRPTTKVLVRYPDESGIAYHWNLCYNCKNLSVVDGDEIRTKRFKKEWLWGIFHWGWWFIAWFVGLGLLIWGLAQ